MSGRGSPAKATSQPRVTPEPGTNPEVVDADAHVVESPQLVGDLIARFPNHLSLRDDGELGLVLEGRPFPEDAGEGAGCPAGKGLTEVTRCHPTSARGVLEDADADGLSHMVLFPGLGLGAPTIEDRDFAASFAQAYNRWLAAFCAEGAGRLHGAAVVPLSHGEAAIDVMTEAADMGLVCTVIPPALAHKNLDHPDLDHFYAAACDLDMALAVHGAPGVHLPKIGVDRFTNYVQVHCVSFPFDQMVALTSLASGGVFDRHPSLRVAFLEAGAGWLPWFVERLGEHFEARGDWIEGGWKRHPAEYVAAGNVMVTCEPDEQMLPAVVDALGDHCVMFASDYPHWDGAWPRSSDELFEHQSGRLHPRSLAKVAGENARRFYRLAS